MRLLAVVLFAALTVPLLACDGGVEDPDITWVYEITIDDTVVESGGLTDANSGDIDLGDQQQGTLSQVSISATNNLEETLNFQLDVNLDAADGFIANTPAGEVPVEPGQSLNYGFRFQPVDPGEVGGTIGFIYDNRVVTWAVSGNGI